MSASHVYELLIREHHLDTFGHVNHAKYLEILEEARWQILEEAGKGLNYIQEHKVGPVILEAHIHYRREVRLRDQLTIHTTMTALNDRIIGIEHRMLNQREELVAEATLRFCLMDLEARKMVSHRGWWDLG